MEILSTDIIKSLSFTSSGEFLMKGYREVPLDLFHFVLRFLRGQS